ncbi:MAG: periplasmic binding protein/LacI transcriptional regulator [Caballeronia sp.]|jgi:ribose transport system substrate-binding protein|uniref:substrate-binding domain-containing protein n=1 Tax=Caballeronia sp. TaxID=1931223 RepID=UPI00262E6474|nr:substrate-binding domain-containing protein [Caballeronia sp.]MDB5833212.1 periplasmic binding protein/LacI transcriptional regulator [Caballeronia sp.]
MNRNRRLITGALASAPFAGLILRAGYVHAQDKKYRFGFSQVTTQEPWRVQFNKDMRAEAAKHPNVELIIADGSDRTDKQNADMENFIAQKMDVIFISPKESSGLTGVVEKAYKAGIPVFVLDRSVNGDAYTQFIGGDNVLIGKGVGEFIVKTQGGVGAAKGNIVEVWGGFGAQASHDRHDGMFESVGKEKGLKIVGQRVDCDWKQDKAYEYMKTVLRVNPQVDVVFGHNDPMAYGAYLAAKDAGVEKKIKFVGADGLPNEGAVWVEQGILTGTFVYPTPGAEGIRQALKLLGGAKIEKKVILPTQGIFADNAKQFVAH